MLLRRQQTLIAALSVLLVALLGAALFLTLRATGEEIARNRVAADLIAKGTSGLRVVTFEFANDGGPRARRQWWARYASLGRLLASKTLDGVPDQPLIAQLRAQHADLGVAFRELDTGVSAEAAAAALEVGFDLRAQLATRVILLTDEMASDARRLLGASQDQVLAAQQRALWLGGALVALVLLLLALQAGLQRRQVLRPVARLQQVAEALGAGELGVRAGMPQENELGQLAHTFDAMAERLQQTIAELARSGAQLAAANQELESFSYSVSHDLRAPLRGIDGWSQALVEDYGPQLDATAQQYLARVRAETQRMGQLIDDLLNLSRTGRLAMSIESVDLSALAEGIAERLLRSNPQRRIAFAIEPDLSAEGDRRLLEIVLTNLFDNACKFSAPRAEAEVTFGRCLALPPGAEQPVEALRVRDNGVGFDMAHAKHLFGAFQRMHKQSEFPGTGIGLATVARIVHRHGGMLWAEAEPGRGASFFFTLTQPEAVADGHPPATGQ